MGSMELTHPDGILPTSPLQAQDLEAQSFQPCRNQWCDHMIAPGTVEDSFNRDGPDGRIQCQHCGLDQNPHKKPGTPGGGTRAGIPMQEQGQIGEDLIESWGEIPGYGPILWWHQGGSTTNSALDGAVPGWGVEVKTYNTGNVRPRGIINANDKKIKADAINDPTLFANKMRDPVLDKYVADHPELKGLLGILVLLDFDKGTADVFAHEMPKNPQTGRLDPSGVQHITRKLVLAEDVPFTSSLPDPRQEGWVPYHLQEKHDNIPF